MKRKKFYILLAFVLYNKIVQQYWTNKRKTSQHFKGSKKGESELFLHHWFWSPWQIPCIEVWSLLGILWQTFQMHILSIDMCIGNAFPKNDPYFGYFHCFVDYYFFCDRLCIKQYNQIRLKQIPLIFFHLGFVKSIILCCRAL